MALIPCPECGRMVSPNAEECPNCGAPVRQMLASNAQAVPEEQQTPIDKSENDSLIIVKAKKTPQEDHFDDNSSSVNTQKKSKKNGLSWILLVLGVIVLAVVAYLFLQDDDGSSSKQPYYVTYGYKPNLKVTVPDAGPLISHNSSESSETMEVYLEGRICSDNNASMRIFGKDGEYHFINYTRTIKVQQYNAATGDLVVYGYEQNTDKYIGKFEGTLTSSKYKGKFTNYKGVECTFDFDVNDSGSSTVSVSASDFEYNAILTDSDGDYTNIRDVNGNIIDKLPTSINYRLYLDGYRGEGDWWFIRGGMAYNPDNGTIRKLKGDDWWIHKSCFTFVD